MERREHPVRRALPRCVEASTTRRWDAIMYNFGLHDLGYSTRRLGVAQYSSNLANITRRLLQLQRRDGTRLLWLTTTPTPSVPVYSGLGGPCTNVSACLNPPRYNDDVLLYNRAAAQVVKRANRVDGGRVETLDIYTLVAQRCDPPLDSVRGAASGGGGGRSFFMRCDGFQKANEVHFEPEGSSAIATAAVHHLFPTRSHM